LKYGWRLKRRICDDENEREMGELEIYKERDGRVGNI